MLWKFFPESALGDGPKKWHIFLFSTASFHTYWHVPFQISIMRKPNWHCICTYNFQFPSPNCDVISDNFGIFFQKTRLVMVSKIYGQGFTEFLNKEIGHIKKFCRPLITEFTPTMWPSLYLKKFPRSFSFMSSHLSPISIKKLHMCIWISFLSKKFCLSLIQHLGNENFFDLNPKISTNQSKSWIESVWLTNELKFDFWKWPHCRRNETNVFSEIFSGTFATWGKTFAINPIDCNAMQFISFIWKVIILRNLASLNLYPLWSLQ